LRAALSGTVPGQWIMRGAFPALTFLDLSKAKLSSFGAAWYSRAKQGGMPRLQALVLHAATVNYGE